MWGKGDNFCGAWDEFEVLVSEHPVKLDVLAWFTGQGSAGPCVWEQ